MVGLFSSGGYNGRTALWPRGSAITSQVLDTEHWVDPRITENIELVGTRTKPPQNLVWTHAMNKELFQSLQWEPLWVHSNQHLVTSCEFLQPLVRLYSRLIAIIDDYHLPCIIFMQLIQM